MYDLTLYFKQAVLGRSLHQITETDNVTGILEVVSRIQVYTAR